MQITLFMRVEYWQHSKPSIETQLKKVWYIHAMEYYEVIKVILQISIYRHRKMSMTYCWERKAGVSENSMYNTIPLL